MKRLPSTVTGGASSQPVLPPPAKPGPRLRLVQTTDDDQDDPPPPLGGAAALVPERDIDGLISAALRGDTDARNRLIEAIQPRIKAVVRRVAPRHSVEDATQDALWDIASRLHTFDPERASFTTWSNTVARSASLKYYRRGMTPFTTLDGEVLASHPSPEDAQPRAEAAVEACAAVIEAASRLLGIVDFAIFQLRRYGLAWKVIADAFGLNASTARCRWTQVICPTLHAEFPLLIVSPRTKPRKTRLAG